MMRKTLLSLFFATGIAVTGAAQADSLKVEFEIPSFDVAKYARPYVAIWAEAANKETKHLLLWHMQRKDDKWLADVRRWWRKIGRYDNYSDGVTGATRGPGTYTETLDLGDWSEMTLFIEVAREDGGRSLVKTPLNTRKDSTISLPADTEVGPITLSVIR